MDGMMGTEEESVFEPQLEEEEDEEDEDEGETYFRTEHVSRTEELQEEVDLAGKVKSNPLQSVLLLIHVFVGSVQSL